MSVTSHAADEVRDLLGTLRERVQDHTARLEAFSRWKEATNGRLESLDTENAELRDRLDALEARLDTVEDGATTKEGKVREIVTYAENARDANQEMAVVTATEIKGAAGISRRYAYDLIDDLPEEYHWITTLKEARERQYGNVELDWEKATRALVIDFEQLHSDPEAVNKFTTRNAEVTD